MFGSKTKPLTKMKPNNRLRLTSWLHNPDPNSRKKLSNSIVSLLTPACSNQRNKLAGYEPKVNNNMEDDFRKQMPGYTCLK